LEDKTLRGSKDIRLGAGWSVYHDFTRDNAASVFVAGQANGVKDKFGFGAVIGADLFDGGSECLGRIGWGNLKKARGPIATSEIKLVGREFKWAFRAAVLEGYPCGEK
jgi:hypothetical protein